MRKFRIIVTPRYNEKPAIHIEEYRHPKLLELESVALIPFTVFIKRWLPIKEMFSSRSRSYATIYFESVDCAKAYIDNELEKDAFYLNRKKEVIEYP